MSSADFSISFRVEADGEVMSQVAARLNRQLAGKIKDLVAQALDGLECDLQERYCLFSLETEAEQPRPRSTLSIPVWSPTDQTFIRVKVGSAEWFELVGNEKKFSYLYEGLSFTVRYETRKSKGQAYTYWRAYATLGGRLRAKHLGTPERLTKEALDAVGAYFLGQREK